VVASVAPGISGNAASATRITQTDQASAALYTEGDPMRRQMLLQSILGHLALLAEKHPKKAASPVARKARQYVTHSLRPAQAENVLRKAA
jgi:hypothetical protein